MDANSTRSKRLWAAINDFTTSNVSTMTRRSVFKVAAEYNNGQHSLTIAASSAAGIIPAIEQEMNRAGLVTKTAADSGSRLYLLMLLIAGSKELYKRRHQH